MRHIKIRLLSLLLIVGMLVGIAPVDVRASDYVWDPENASVVVNEETDDDVERWRYDEEADEWYLGTAIRNQYDEVYKDAPKIYQTLNNEHNNILIAVGDYLSVDTVKLYARKVGTKKWILKCKKLPVKDNFIGYNTCDVIHIGLKEATQYEYRLYSEVCHKYSKIYRFATSLRNSIKVKKKGDTISWTKVPNATGYTVYYTKHWEYNEGLITKDKHYKITCKSNVNSYKVGIKDKKHISISDYEVVPFKKFKDGTIVETYEEYSGSSEDALFTIKIK